MWLKQGRNFWIVFGSVWVETGGCRGYPSPSPTNWDPVWRYGLCCSRTTATSSWRWSTPSDFVGVLVGCTELPHGLVGGACGVDPEVGSRASYGRLGFGAVPQRGLGTAGFRFRTYCRGCDPSWAFNAWTSACPPGAFLPLPAMLKVDPGVDRGVHHFARAGFAAGRSTHRHWVRSSGSTQRRRAMTWSWGREEGEGGGVGVWARV